MSRDRYERQNVLLSNGVWVYADYDYAPPDRSTGDNARVVLTEVVTKAGESLIDVLSLDELTRIEDFITALHVGREILGPANNPFLHDR